MSVLQAKSSRNCSKLYKTQPFIQMPCMNVTLYNRIELQHPESKLSSHFQTV